MKGSVLKISFYRRPGTTHAYEGTYNESLSYDKNGNIKTLHRNGGFDMQGSLETMDDLSYTYEMYSNKLIKVTDPTSNTQGFDNGNSGNNENLIPYKR